jgi:hypothetical protein
LSAYVSVIGHSGRIGSCFFLLFLHRFVARERAGSIFLRLRQAAPSAPAVRMPCRSAVKRSRPWRKSAKGRRLPAFCICDAAASLFTADKCRPNLIHAEITKKYIYFRRSSAIVRVRQRYWAFRQDRILLFSAIFAPVRRSRKGREHFPQAQAGCSFCPRCPYAMPVCSEKIPPLAEIGKGERAACFLYL